MVIVKKPRSTTVKRLFALSGNRCAFPRCSTPIVDETGCVVGEICHIHSHRSDGPRYNRAQTDAQRHGFDNLILLCAVHHKRIDTKQEDYPVGKLRQWKLDHEQQFSQSKVSGTDDVIAELLRKFAITLSVAGTANTVVMGDVNIIVREQAGMRQLTQELYRANALHHKGRGADLATERAYELNENFLQALFRRAIPPAVLGSPDMQYALVSAQRTAARSESPDLSGMLVDLLVERAAAQDDDFSKIILNEAIDVTARLTRDQFDALSLILSMKYVLDRNVRDVEAFRCYLDRLVFPFFRTASTAEVKYQHLEYVGCVVRAYRAGSAIELFATRYGHVFAKGLSKNQLRTRFRPGEFGDERVLLAVFRATSEDELDALPQFPDESVRILRGVGVNDLVIHRLLGVIVESARRGFQGFPPTVIHSELSNFIEEWSRSGAPYGLTSVGIAIAHANLRRRGINDYPLSQWISQ